MDIQLPMAPTFKISDIGSSTYIENDLSFEFHLINKDTYWLDKNFRFLQAFYAGTQWLQMDFGMIQGTNVYNVLCPGRFNIVWASIGTTITNVGKLRKNNFMAERYDNVIKSIDKDILWPDAWKISINIKPLVPNNFNMYMSYYLHGYGTTFKKMRNITNLNNRSSTLGVLGEALDKAKEELVGKDVEKHIKELEEMRKRQQAKYEQHLKNIGNDSLLKIHEGGITERKERMKNLLMATGDSKEQANATLNDVANKQRENMLRENIENEDENEFNDMEY